MVWERNIESKIIKRSWFKSFLLTFIDKNKIITQVYRKREEEDHLDLKNQDEKK